MLLPVVARANGEVVDVPGMAAAADTGIIIAARRDDYIPMPDQTLLLTLPDRSPMAFAGRERRELTALDGAAVSGVAAALPLGYTRTALPAYVERAGAPPLPLYGYAAVAWGGDGFYVAAVRTDALDSWQPGRHVDHDVRAAVAQRLAREGNNPLLRQVALCATSYGCFTAQNVFLAQGEAALPVSTACNARCVGCISEQLPEEGVASPHERISVAVGADDIAAVAIAHLRAVPDGIVSFGQGCEGEPLLAAPRIAGAIERIRAAVHGGTVHINTNASDSQALSRLIDAGLQSMRASLNSARPGVYSAYYRPRGYSFEDVMASLEVARDRGIAIALNLLTHPGVTDDPDEMEAFGALMARIGGAQVQTRTLNIDPARYFAIVGRPKRTPAGMRAWLDWVAALPHVRVGNFTRPIPS